MALVCKPALGSQGVALFGVFHPLTHLAGFQVIQIIWSALKAVIKQAVPAELGITGQAQLPMTGSVKFVKQSQSPFHPRLSLWVISSSIIRDWAQLNSTLFQLLTHYQKVRFRVRLKWLGLTGILTLPLTWLPPLTPWPHQFGFTPG